MCCVRDCHNRSDRDRDKKFFSVPFVVSGKGKETKELTSKRRREWLAQLRLTDELQFMYKTCIDHIGGYRPTVGLAVGPAIGYRPSYQHYRHFLL